MAIALVDKWLQQNKRNASLPNDSINPSEPLRVTIVQPALPKYRIPVFQQLANRPNLDLLLSYGERQSLENIKPTGFAASPSRVRSPSLFGKMLYLHWAQWKYASRKYSDVLMLSWSPRYATLLPSLLKARWNGVPTVLWGHGYSKQEHGLIESFRRLLGKLGTSLLFYDPLTAERYLNIGWERRKIYVALNSIDEQAIESARQHWYENKDQLKQFQVQQEIEHRPVVLHVSRLQPMNRVDLLIQATARIVGEVPDLKVLIIGNGDEERKRLKKISAELGVTEQVLFLPGIYNEEELAPWFLSADVFCYPENIGLSILHSFWYGLPLVTSAQRECHNPEIVAFESGSNGLAYEHGDIDSLASALKELLLNAPMRQAMSEKARETVENRFTVENMVDGMEAAVRYASANL